MPSPGFPSLAGSQISPVSPTETHTLMSQAALAYAWDLFTLTKTNVTSPQDRVNMVKNLANQGYKVQSRK